MHVLDPIALNVSWSDLQSLSGFETAPELPLVSAHIRGPGIRPFVESTVGDQRVVLTGIAHEGPSLLVPDRYTLGDSVEGVRQALKDADVHPEDLVVLLSSQSNTVSAMLAREGLVDL
ncbi:MAG TPA: hypothetical protein DFR83_23415, partial [Deltaproteobacteria bacterium]|nr:hypothetical protein [Deltaproteobacteria bacterium]